MNVSRVFIERPIATSLIMLGIAVFGVVAHRVLPVSDLPNVDFPALNVAGLSGGGPTTMARPSGRRASMRLRFRRRRSGARGCQPSVRLPDGLALVTPG
jgi:hypothetical protein